MVAIKGPYSYRARYLYALICSLALMVSLGMGSASNITLYILRSLCSSSLKAARMSRVRSSSASYRSSISASSSLSFFSLGESKKVYAKDMTTTEETTATEKKPKSESNWRCQGILTCSKINLTGLNS
ncbi:MAG: hypothetical protein EBS08_03255 [Cytophagia bacterium]|nr:hypothetical protein [Cytophagia bacterium]